MKQTDSISSEKLSIQLFPGLERCIKSTSRLQDVSILLKSTCFQSSQQEYATHQPSTALNKHSRDNQTRKQTYPTRRNFREYFNCKANFSIFPICLLPSKHKNKNHLSNTNLNLSCGFQHHTTQHCTLKHKFLCQMITSFKKNKTKTARSQRSNNKCLSLSSAQTPCSITNVKHYILMPSYLLIVVTITAPECFANQEQSPTSVTNEFYITST